MPMKKLKTKERYAFAIKSSQMGLWDWDIQSDKLYLSSFLKELIDHGSDAEPLFTLTQFKQYVHPDDVGQAFNLLQQHLKEHTPYDTEFRLRTKTGEFRWFHAVGKAHWDNDGVAIRMAGSLSDITKHKSAEQRLAAQYETTRIIAEASDLEIASKKIVQTICQHLGWECGAIWMVNYTNNELDCVGMWYQPFLETSIQAFKDMTYKTKFTIGAGLPGRVWVSAKPLWIVDVVVDSNFPRALAAKRVGFHTAFSFPIVLQNQVLGVIEFFKFKIQLRDEALINMMTAVGPQIGQFIQRKRMETELRQSESYKTAILESATDSIMTINDKGVIDSFNSQTMKTFGYTQNELKNKHINKLVPDLSTKIIKLVGKPAMDLTVFRKDGSHFYADININNMHSNKDNMFVCIIHDISERIKLDQIKNEFISIASHELRTPLTSIKGAIGLLLGRFNKKFSVKARQLLEIADANCERLIRLVNDILDIEKIEAGKMIFRFDSINLKNLVHDAVIANKEYARKFKVKIKEMNKSDIYVNGDYDRLTQVVTNFLSNAIKFSPKSGTVTVSVSTYNHSVRVAVIDHGEGIPLAFQDKIFEKFAQADASNAREMGGTGLGLSISKNIIEKHQGIISFISDKKEGTTFYFDLPCVEIKKL